MVTFFCLLPLRRNRKRQKSCLGHGAIVTSGAFGWVLVCMGLFVSPAHAERPFVIATDDPDGLRQVVGSSLCRQQPRDGRPCKTIASDSSLGNIRHLIHGKAQFAVVAGDVAYQAWTGQPPFKSKHDRLRLVFHLYADAMALVSRQDAGIQKLKDILEKRINIGVAGSMSQQAVLELLVTCEIWPSDILETRRENIEKMPENLGKDNLDAYFNLTHHPVKDILETQKATPINLANLNDPCIDTFVKKFPYYQKVTIQVGTYPGITQPVQSFGVDTLLLTTAKVPSDTVEEFAAAILDNTNTLKKRHPVFSTVNRKSLTEPSFIPFHNGVKPFLAATHRK